MSTKPDSKTATILASKKVAGATGTKTTGETKVDYRLMAPCPAPGSKLCGFGTNDKYTMSFNTEETMDFCLASFLFVACLPRWGALLPCCPMMAKPSG
jgi:hypothetical protein